MQVQQDLSELRGSPIDITDIEMKIRDFYLTIDFESDNFLAEIFEAKHILESARIIVFNLINPYENEYIFSYLTAYKELSENLSRADRYFDELERDTLTKYEMSIPYQKPAKQHSKSYFIINYVRKLDVLLEHLVYHPIKNAYLRFKKPIIRDGKECLKDENLFCYFIFVELYKSSQVLGNIMYEKKKTTSGSGVSYDQPYENQPEEIPKNVKVSSEDSGEKFVKSAEDYFKDEIGGEDEDSEYIQEEEKD